MLVIDRTISKRVIYGVYTLFTLVFFYTVYLSITGVFWIDEIYYQAEIASFAKGAKLLTSTWSPYQFGTFVLSPIVWVYKYIVGSTTGLVLFMRVVFCVIQYLAGLFTIHQLSKRFSVFVGLSCSLFLILYTPSTIYI